MKKAILDAFRTLDRDLVSIPYRVIPNFESTTPEALASLPLEQKQVLLQKLLPTLDGSCALIAYLENKDLYVAHAGDSRAVLGRRTASGGWEAIDLTRDHQPAYEFELERLRKEHPGEEADVAFARKPGGVIRVLGGFMCSRG